MFGKGKCKKLIGNCAIFWQGKCKLIANFSATMVTSLPSLSVSLYLSLSVSLSLSLSLSHTPNVPHAQYRKRFRASYNRKRFRASYNTERERERRKWRHLSSHNGDLSVKGETGSVKGETKSANVWQGKV